MRGIVIGFIAIAIASSANAKERKIVDPLAPDIIANNHIVSVDVRLAPTVAEKMQAFEKKAAEKRAAAKLPPIQPINAAAPVEQPDSTTVTAENTPTSNAGAEASTIQSSPKDQYDTLPFAQMFPLVVQDVTREWGLTQGRPIKLVVTVDTLKTADAAMAILLSSSDQLAGMVEVRDAMTDSALGSFYIDVLNSHGGFLGMAMRGSGVREKLAEEFALQTSRVLTGRKSKKAKKAQA